MGLCSLSQPSSRNQNKPKKTLPSMLRQDSRVHLGDPISTLLSRTNMLNSSTRISKPFSPAQTRSLRNLDITLRELRRAGPRVFRSHTNLDIHLVKALHPRLPSSSTSDQLLRSTKESSSASDDVFTGPEQFSDSIRSIGTTSHSIRPVGGTPSEECSLLGSPCKVFRPNGGPTLDNETKEAVVGRTMNLCKSPD